VDHTYVNEAVMLAPNIDEVSVGAEAFAKRPTVGLVPGSFEATDQFISDVPCASNHIFSSTTEISADRPLPTIRGAILKGPAHPLKAYLPSRVELDGGTRSGQLIFGSGFLP
jgi:hypothetical protein